MTKTSADDWNDRLVGLRVLVFSPNGSAVGYGQVMGYELINQHFFVLMDDDTVGDPDYVAWMDVRPA